MLNTKKRLMLYTSATCNLSCKYCIIDKNLILKQIDNALEESFKTDYYFDFAKEIFKDKDQLTTIEFWGGEPFLSMHRAYDVTEKLLSYFQNINKINISTNLVAPNFIDELAGLLAVFKKFDRVITLVLQVSLDGPKIITDANRGNGVTNRLLEQFNALIKALPNIVPENVVLDIHFKQTLDVLSMYLLNTEEKILNYFEFFESLYKLFNDNIKNKNIVISGSMPNFATPPVFTQDDGKVFKEFCSKLVKVSTEHEFKTFKNIVLFSLGGSRNDYDRLSGGRSFCGISQDAVGLLPNRFITTCVTSFVNLIADYKKAMLDNVNRTSSIDNAMFINYYANAFCFPVDELEKFEKIAEPFFKSSNVATVLTTANEIMVLAQANQVQEKYKNKDEAIKGANFILSHATVCPKDNLGAANSFYAMPIGTLKMFLNGAEDVILEWEKEQTKNENIPRRTK